MALTPRTDAKQGRKELADFHIFEVIGNNKADVFHLVKRKEFPPISYSIFCTITEHHYLRENELKNGVKSIITWKNFICKQEENLNLSQKDYLDPFEHENGGRKVLNNLKPKGNFCSQCQANFNDFYQHVESRQHVLSEQKAEEKENWRSIDQINSLINSEFSIGDFHGPEKIKQTQEDFTKRSIIQRQSNDEFETPGELPEEEESPV